MSEFLRRNWVWVVAPVVVILVLAAVVWWLAQDSAVSPFTYGL